MGASRIGTVFDFRGRFGWGHTMPLAASGRKPELKRLICCKAALIATSLFAPAYAHAEEVAFIAILNVPAGNAQAFDALARDMVEASATDDGLLIYEFARVGETVYGYERYVDAAAHARHEALIEPFIPQLVELAQFKKIVTLSQLTDDHQELFQSIGAEIGQPIAAAAQGPSK
ncbi:putative quinol monooxygenase [Ruegeria arenilitoris]|uniref:putative quinol monooxygenase n=2 Tax=Ruegeria arenilitoris TaxID=1173585 RepID=UPI00147DAC37|nr:antibiotic biosynthesis monooxygenase [Ruegeria arenilitoris]